MKDIALLIGSFLLALSTYSQCENFEMELSGSDPTCHNYNDGAVSINISGSNGWPTVSITDSTGTIYTPIPGGTGHLLTGDQWYYVEAQDDSSCYLIDSVYLVNPPPILAEISYVEPTSLNNCDGILSVDTVINNQGPYENIGFYWSPGGPSGIGENVKNDCCHAFYDVIIVDAIGCDYHEVISSGSASILSPDISFEIYPNPSSGTFFIQWEGIVVQRIEIIDLSGKTLARSGPVHTFDLSNFQAGTYILKMVTETGVYTEILIRE